MNASQSEIIVADPGRLNLDLYEQYDSNFLFAKALTLQRIVERDEDFKEWAADEDLNELDPKKYKNALTTEIRVTEAQQAEALFALMNALFQPLPHWLYLTRYRVPDIKEKIQLYLDRKFAELTGGQIATRDEYLNTAIYSGLVSNEKDKAARWSENLESLDWLLQECGRRYIGAQEYNAYKHGVRAIPMGATTITITPTEEPAAKPFVLSSPHSLCFLEVGQVEGDFRRVYKTFKNFDAEASLHFLSSMRAIVESLLNSRAARIRGDSGAKINTFFNVDRRKILVLCQQSTFRISA
jgi:hypothetical protein